MKNKKSTVRALRDGLLFLGMILATLWHVSSCPAAFRPLRVAYLSTSGTMAPLWMAKETGALMKEGVEATM